jgi:hypothetical protein
MYGDTDHDHHDLSRSINDARYDADGKVNDLRQEMWEMRRELTDYIRTEVEGLYERLNRGDA